jgi:hypothetical protein
MSTSSTIEFALIRTRPGRPASACAISRSTRSTSPLRSERGADQQRR